MRKIKRYTDARAGKNALRNYIRDLMARKRAWNSDPAHNWTDGFGEFHDVTKLANRLEVVIVKWVPRYHAALVCVHDKTKPMTCNPFDGNSYRWFYTYNDMEFYKIWEMYNAVENRLLFPKHS